MNWILFEKAIPPVNKWVAARTSDGKIGGWKTDQQGNALFSDYDNFIEWLDEAQPEANPKLEKIVDEHQQLIHVFHSGDLADKVSAVLRHYKHDAAKAISERKQMTTDTLVYFRSIIMVAEMVGMGGTHHEKDARLRGLIELLNQAIKKLQAEEHDSLLNNWGYGFGGRSDYPYRSLLDEMRQLKYQNEELKKQLNGTTAPGRHPNDDLPI